MTATNDSIVGGRAGKVIRRGRHVDLYPVDPTSYPVLHTQLNDPRVARTWRTRGRSFGGAELESILFDGVRLSNLVVDKSTGAVVGLVELISYNPTDQYGDLVVAAFPPADQTGLAIEGALLFIDECFQAVPLRKIYFSVSDDALGMIGQGLFRIAAVEGTLREHVFLNGRYQNVTVLAFTSGDLQAWLDASPGMGALSEGGWRTSVPSDQRSQSVRQLVALIVGVNEQDLVLEKELEIDSLDTIELVAGLEEIVGRELPVELGASFVTVGDVVSFVDAVS